MKKQKRLQDEIIFYLQYLFLDNNSFCFEKIVLCGTDNNTEKFILLLKKKSSNWRLRIFIFMEVLYYHPIFEMVLGF